MGVLATTAKASVSAPAPAASRRGCPLSDRASLARPGAGTRGSGAAELRALQTAARGGASLFPRPPCPPGRALRPWYEVPRSPSARAGASRPAPSRPPSSCAPGCSKLLSGPTCERRGGAGVRGTCQRPRPLCSQALPCRLPGRRRRRHTWGARGCKLGGDVNGPGWTSPRTSAAGQAGWDGEKVARTPQRQSNDIGEGGGDRGDAPSPLRPLPPHSPAGSLAPFEPSGELRRLPGRLTDSEGRPDPRGPDFHPASCSLDRGLPNLSTSAQLFAALVPSKSPALCFPPASLATSFPAPRHLLEPSEVLLAAVPSSAMRATPPSVGGERNSFATALTPT